MSDIDLDAIEWGEKRPWNGGRRPVSGPVRVWFRDGSAIVVGDACVMVWEHLAGNGDIIAYAVPAEPKQGDKVRDLMHAVVSLCDVAEVSPVALRDALADLYPLPEPAEQPPKWGRKLVSAGDGRRPVPEDEMLRFRDWAGSGMAEESMAYTADWDKPRTFQRLASAPDYDLGVEEVYGPETRLDVGELVSVAGVRGLACEFGWALRPRFRRVLRYADEPTQ